MFIFKKYPLNQNPEYETNNNIITKTGTNGSWIGIICEGELNQLCEEYIWQINILKTHCYQIMIGAATIDYDINNSSYNTNGWYYYCSSGTLYSGPPYNYCNYSVGLQSQVNEIKIIMNIKNRTLNFVINNNNVQCYANIPLDKGITPCVHLYNINDSVEIKYISKK